MLECFTEDDVPEVSEVAEIDRLVETVTESQTGQPGGQVVNRLVETVIECQNGQPGGQVVDLKM